MVDHADSATQERPPLRAELQVALNLIPAHTWYANPSGALTFVNQRGADYLGLAKDHPLRFGIDNGAAWDSHITFLHADDQQETRRVWSTCLRTGDAGQVSFRVRNADGEYCWFLSRAEPVRANDGTLLYWIAVNFKIEDTMQAESSLADGDRLARPPMNPLMYDDLRESKARLEEAQRVAHVGHWEWDLETDVVVWSDETYRIFGLRPQERPMDLATVQAMVHPEDRESLYLGVDEDLVAGVRPNAEFRIVLPSGEVRIVHALTSKRWSSMPGDAKRDAIGRPYKLFGTVQDITDRVRAEEERQALSRDLEESKAWLEEAQRVAHLGYWVWNLETSDLIWSDETYRIFGLMPQEELIDLDKLRAMIHPDDREAVFRTAEEAVRSGTRADCEHRIFRPG